MAHSLSASASASWMIATRQWLGEPWPVAECMAISPSSGTCRDGGRDDERGVLADLLSLTEITLEPLVEYHGSKSFLEPRDHENLIGPHDQSSHSTGSEEQVRCHLSEVSFSRGQQEDVPLVGSDGIGLSTTHHVDGSIAMMMMGTLSSCQDVSRLPRQQSG